MAMWRSRAGGNRDASWKDWAIASVTVWLAPVFLGVAVLALAYAISTAVGATGSSSEALHPVLALFLAGYVLVFSPMFSWAGLLVAIVPAWALLRLGLGGWASFLALGLVAGALAGGLFQGFSAAMGAGFGGLAALAFRRILSALKPEIFTTR